MVLLNDQDEVTSVFKEKLMINATLYRDSKTGLYRVILFFSPPSSFLVRLVFVYSRFPFSGEVCAANGPAT